MNPDNLSDWVLPRILARQAAARPQKIYVATSDGEALRYGEATDQAERMAGFFTRLGIRPGDAVAVLLPNGLDFVAVWLGLGRLGATIVPINTELTGSFLAHQLSTSAAKAVVAHSHYLKALGDILAQLPHVHSVVVAGEGDHAKTVDALRYVSLGDFRSAEPFRGAMPHPSDIACIIFTSGTTGPSKGVLMPHAHCYLMGFGIVDNCRLTEADKYYIVMPLFHGNGLFLQLYSTLIVGASAYLRQRFSASEWLEDIRRERCTVTNTLGAMASFVFAQPATNADRDHCLRVIMLAPNPPENDRVWRERFGVRHVMTGFGMTEANMSIYSRMDESRPGTAGYVYAPYFEVEIHDQETDQICPDGQVGEIVVRPKVPYGLMAGYCGMPEQTVAAWRNLWFHTGDAGVRDANGVFSFVDRLKDCIRRRGENISSFEVESAIGEFKGVQTVAAYAIPASGPGAEDEVMLAVVVNPAAGLTTELLAKYAAMALPRFAQPRYIEIVTDLPTTPTGKIRKDVLRRRGITPDTWDRERNGFGE